MKTAGRWIAAMIFLAIFAGVAQAATVSIERQTPSPQVDYAAGKLNDALVAKGYSLDNVRLASDYVVTLAVNGRAIPAEGFTIRREGHRIIVSGGDARGVIYGALALADDVRHGVDLDKVAPRTEKARLPFRAIKFNLPWDSYRASAALEQHRATVWDTKFWEAFLDMMAANRFNALTLWNLHPWPYMIRTKGFPEANGFSEAELAEWRKLHQAIFRMARERGIDTYLVPWNIYVSKEFVAARGVGKLNIYPYYNTPGDTSPIIKQYVRQSVAQTLEEYPDLTGIGLSHSEAMGGMTAEARDRWVADTYLAAARSVKRPVKIIMKVPSSSGPVMDGSTSVETEQLTRRTLESIDFAKGPVWLTPKFNWSHGHSTTTLVGVHGGAFGDTYFKPAPKNYKVVWTLRNEDFFALRWGDPAFVREHIERNASADYIGGYIIGSETYIPALDYFTPPGMQGSWRYAFERQWLFYELWGRLLYDADTPDAVFAQSFVDRYGARGEPLLPAYALASRTALRLASLFNSTWDHTLYSEGMMWLKGSKMAYIDADSLIKQPALDPVYVSVGDYVAATVKGQHFAVDRITPPRLADQLDKDCREALRMVDDIDPKGDMALMYEVADIRTWAHLGLHLAEELRGATALQTYRLGGGDQHKAQAVAHLEKALEEWDEVVRITRPIYRDMLLTHMTGSSKALQPDAPFHWALIRPQVEADVEAARAATR